MSITNELRTSGVYEYAAGNRHFTEKELLAIADRIDAEHERQLGVLYRDMSDAEWVRLPLDADEVPWNVGDRDEDGNVVTQLRLSSDGWYAVTNGLSAFHPEQRRHYHAPTVEDVLREFADRVCNSGHQWGLDAAGTIAEYAAKLRLAEKEDA